MKRNISQSILASLFVILALSGSAIAYDYNVQLSWTASVDPMVFSIGKLFKGQDLGDPDNINFESLEPFFQVSITPIGNNFNADNEFVIWIRMSGPDGETIWTVYTEPVTAGQYANGVPINNSFIANNIGLDTDTDIGPEDLLPYLDGGNIKEGVYEIVAYLTSVQQDYGDIDEMRNIYLSNPASLTLWTRNPNQVELVGPDYGANIQNGVATLQWRFPRQEGVKFNLKVVSGDDDDDPWTAIESYGDDPGNTNFYANIDFDIQGDRQDLTQFVYTPAANLPGHASGDINPLVEGRTYFWQITAEAPTMFDNDPVIIQSPVYTFDYVDQRGGGRHGGDEEGAPPRPEARVFTVLRQSMSSEQFSSIRTSLEGVSDLSAWRVSDAGIYIDGYPVTIDELSKFLLLGDHSVTYQGIQ